MGRGLNGYQHAHTDDCHPFCSRSAPDCCAALSHTSSLVQCPFAKTFMLVPLNIRLFVQFRRLRHPPFVIFALFLYYHLCKSFERIVLNKVKCNLFPCYNSNQHAYRPFGSTTTALVDLHDHVTKALDCK